MQGSPTPRRLGLAVWIGLAACSVFIGGVVLATPSQRTIETTQDKVAVGRTTFAGCAACHGPSGEGVPSLGPVLNSDSFLSAASDEFLVRTIAEGRAGTTMVAWGGTYSSEQIEAVVAFMRTWSDAPPADLDESPLNGNVDNGAQLFIEICASCHGPRGDGFSAGGSGNGIGRAAFLEVASDGYLRHMIRNGKTGTAMRSFGPGRAMSIADLTNREIDDIIAYLRVIAW